jgi:hypothetical protein
MLNREAEAEIERLVNAWYAVEIGPVRGLCRAAMEYAYRDAARVCRERGAKYLGSGQQSCSRTLASLIESRLTETPK